MQSGTPELYEMETEETTPQLAPTAIPDPMIPMDTEVAAGVVSTAPSAVTGAQL